MMQYKKYYCYDTIMLAQTYAFGITIVVLLTGKEPFLIYKEEMMFKIFDDVDYCSYDFNEHKLSVDIGERLSELGVGVGLWFMLSNTNFEVSINTQRYDDYFYKNLYIDSENEENEIEEEREEEREEIIMMDVEN